jgi:ABC-type glycerol-3-phosphate transport system substrate-binding protein
MRHRRFVAVFTILCCILSLAACDGKGQNDGKGQKSDSVTEAATKEPTAEPSRQEEIPSPTPTPDIDLGGLTVTLADWWTPENWDKPNSQYETMFFDMLYEAEEQNHFSFVRRNTGFGYEEYATKVAETIRNNDPAGSVITVRLSDIGTLLRDGLLLDVSGSGSIDLKDDCKWRHRNGATDLLCINGKQYGLDWEQSEPGLGIYFNKELLKKAGVDPELPYNLQKPNFKAGTTGRSWTWEEFLALCEQLKTGKTSDVVTLAGVDAEVVFGVLLSDGTNVIEKTENGLLAVNGDDPAVKEALTFAKELKDRGYFTSMTPEECKQAFLEGKVAVLIAEERMSSYFLANEDLDWGYACFPYGPSQGKLTSIILDDDVYFVPNCGSCSGKADEILFVFDRYTDHPECMDGDSYYAHDGWMAKYDWKFKDERAIIETLMMMLGEDSDIPIAMNDTVLLANFDTSWATELLNGGAVDEILQKNIPNWLAKVQDFNKNFS